MERAGGIGTTRSSGCLCFRWPGPTKNGNKRNKRQRIEKRIAIAGSEIAAVGRIVLTRASCPPGQICLGPARFLDRMAGTRQAHRRSAAMLPCALSSPSATRPRGTRRPCTSYRSKSAPRAGGPLREVLPAGELLLGERARGGLARPCTLIATTAMWPIATQDLASRGETLRLARQMRDLLVDHFH
jgi:hypothetical protein